MYIDGGQQFRLGIVFKFLDDASMTHLGRRGSHEAREFKDIASLERVAPFSRVREKRLAHCITGQKTPCTFVVTTHYGGVFVADDLTVEDYDGNAGIHRFGYGRGDVFGFVGRDGNQIDLLVDEVTDILDLLLAIVVATDQFHRNTIVQEQFAFHLGVLFRAPRSLGALRHADAQSWFPRRSAGTE